MARREADHLIGRPNFRRELGREFEQGIMEWYRTEYMVDGASLQATVEDD